MSEVLGGALLAHAAGDGPVAVGACSVCVCDSLLGVLGVEALLPLLVAFLVACVCVAVSRKRNVLLAGEDVLYLADVYIPCCGAVCYSNCCCNTCCLACANALRDQVYIVYGYLVRGDVAARSQDVVYLLRQYGAVGDLYWSVVVKGVDGGVPCDNVVVLLGEYPVVGVDYLNAHDSV